MNISAKFLQSRSKLMLVLAGLLIGALNAVAQSTPATPAAPAAGASETDDETVILSPFEVDASNDIGYYAENTLAGSRINTNVGDLASSITVVTKQQLDDTGSVDINDVFLYEANTEGAATYTPYIFNRSQVRDGIGGYSGDDGGTFGIATANRVRGLGAADTAQNNYPTLSRMAFDTYNTNSVEINRGPNSMLFGTGSPAGIVNQSTSAAVIGRNAFSVSARFGSFDAQRFSASANVGLGEHLAFYAAILRDERGFQRKPSYDEYDREYIAVTVQPTKTTKLTASYENYENRNNRPNFISPSDFVTPWIQAGRPGWNPATQIITFADGRTTLPYLQNTTDPRYVSAPAGAKPPVGDSALTDLRSPFFVGGIQFLGGRSTLRIDDAQILNFFAPNGTSGGAAPGLPAVGSRTPEQHIAAAARYTSSRAFLPFTPDPSTGATEYGRWTEVSVADRSIYDWEKYNIQGGNYGEQEGSTANIEFEQQITRNLFLSAGWFRQEFEEVTHYALGQANQAARLYVDTNTHHLDGTPNPYFGVPYVFDSQADTFYVPENNNNYRAMLAYTADFTKSDNWTRHLGSHRLLGLWSKQETWRNNLRYRQSFEAPGDARFLPTPASLAAAGNSRTSWGGNAANIQRIYYLGEAGQPTVTKGVEYIEEAGWGGPTSASLRFYDWNTNPQGFANTPMNFSTNLFYAGGNYGVSTKTIDSYSVAWQGRLWNERIIPTIGWRTDKLVLQSYNGGRIGNGPPLTNEQFYANGDGVEGLWNNLASPFAVDGETTTKGVVVRPFQGFDSIEQSAQNGSFFSQLLEGLSFHYNESDNFNPPTSIQVDFFDRNLPKPSGDGKDYGVGVSLFDNKFVLNLNWYESNNKNAPASAASTVIGRSQRIDTASAKRWAEYIVRIRHGQDPRTDLNFHNNTVNPLSAQQQDEITALQWGAFELGTYNWPEYSGTIAGTESNTSKGMEMSMIYNPKRNWNIKLTVGQQEATYSDAIGELQEWIDYRKPIWQSMTVSGLISPVDGVDLSQPITRANGNRLYLGSFWDGYGFTQDAVFNDAPSNATGGTGSPAATYASIVEPDFFTLTANQDTTVANLHEWSASLISNYSFQEGRLKGFAVGGSIRWIDEAQAAYYGETDPSRYSHPPGAPPPPAPANAVRSVIVFPDLNRPIFTPAELNLDLWFSYTTRLFNDKTKMKIQVNVRDVTESGGLQTVSFNMDGSPAQRRIKDPRQWFVTTTFDF